MVSTSLLLAHAQRRTAEAVAQYSYDPDAQVNLTSNGGLAITDAAIMLASGGSFSTAGSKTHVDD